MLLLVGLGNPGPEYQRQRHNIGFMAVDAIADTQKFAAAKRKFQGELREGVLADCRAFALKPQTFMNESGRAVSEAVRFFKLVPAQVIVFHDELDLAPGKVKIKQGGGLAGHNGLRSIEAHIGADFRRVRLGIGHPGDKARVTGHVLGDFSKADATWLAPLLDAIAAAAPRLIAGDAAFSMALSNILNPKPPNTHQPAAPALSPRNLSPRKQDSAPPNGDAGPFADALAPLKRDEDTP